MELKDNFCSKAVSETASSFLSERRKQLKSAPCPRGCCNCKDLLNLIPESNDKVQLLQWDLLSWKQDIPDFPQQLSQYNPNKLIFPAYSVVFIKMPFRISCVISHFIQSPQELSTNHTHNPTQHGHTAAFTPAN